MKHYQEFSRRTVVAGVLAERTNHAKPQTGRLRHAPLAETAACNDIGRWADDGGVFHCE